MEEEEVRKPSRKSVGAYFTLSFGISTDCSRFSHRREAPARRQHGRHRLSVASVSPVVAEHRCCCYHDQACGSQSQRLDLSTTAHASRSCPSHRFLTSTRSFFPSRSSTASHRPWLLSSGNALDSRSADSLAVGYSRHNPSGRSEAHRSTPSSVDSVKPSRQFGRMGIGASIALARATSDFRLDIAAAATSAHRHIGLRSPCFPSTDVRFHGGRRTSASHPHSSNGRRGDATVLPRYCWSTTDHLAEELAPSQPDG